MCIYIFIREVPMFFFMFFPPCGHDQGQWLLQGCPSHCSVPCLGAKFADAALVYQCRNLSLVEHTLHCKHWVWKLEPLMFGGICHTLRSTLKQRVVNNHTCLKLKSLKSFLSIVADTHIIVVESASNHSKKFHVALRSAEASEGFKGHANEP